MHLSRTALLLTIVGVISLAAASTVGVLGFGGAFDTASRFQPACEAPALPGSVVTVTLTNMGMGMGMGMMGGGMGPMGMATADTKVDVKNIDKGVTITITSPDPARVARLQKMAEAMRLMHEANVP